MPQTKAHFSWTLSLYPYKATFFHLACAGNRPIGNLVVLIKRPLVVLVLSAGVDGRVLCRIPSPLAARGLLTFTKRLCSGWPHAFMEPSRFLRGRGGSLASNEVRVYK